MSISMSQPSPNAPQEPAEMHLELVKALSLFPEADHSPAYWSSFVRNSLVNVDPDSPDTKRIEKAAIFVLQSRRALEERKIAVCARLIEAIVDAWVGLRDQFDPGCLRRILEKLEWRIGVQAAFRLLRTPEPLELALKYRTWALKAVSFEGDEASFMDFFGLFTSSRRRADQMVLDDSMAHPRFLRLLESVFANKRDDAVFFDLFIEAFYLKSMGIRQTLFKGLGKANFDLGPFERHFEYMRHGAIFADLEKFPLAVIEEKARDRRDLQIILDVLVSKPHSTMDEAQAFAARHGLRPTRKSAFQGKKFVDKGKPGPEILVDQDAFAPTSFNLLLASRNTLIFCEDMGVARAQLVWVDSDEGVRAAAKNLLNRKLVAFDSEFYRDSYGPFEKQKLALIQLFAGSKVYLIDCLVLCGHAALAAFMKDLFEAPHIIKAGLGLTNDFLVLEEAFKLSGLAPQSTLDLSMPSKTRNQVSLKLLCQHYFGRDLCKLEQASAWRNRPLRLGQLHYAALDAIIVFKMVEALAGSANPSFAELSTLCSATADSVNAARHTSKKSAPEPPSDPQPDLPPPLKPLKTEPPKELKTQPPKEATLPPSPFTMLPPKNKAGQKEYKRNKQHASQKHTEETEWVPKEPEQRRFRRRPKNKTADFEWVPKEPQEKPPSNNK